MKDTLRNLQRHHLKEGLSLFIRSRVMKSTRKLEALVFHISRDKIRLNLDQRPDPCPFKVGERIHLQYTDDDERLYHCDAVVLGMLGNHRIWISLPNSETAIRSQGFPRRIPFSFTMRGSIHSGGRAAIR